MLTMPVLLVAARGPLDTWSPTLMAELAFAAPALAAVIILTFAIDSRRGTAIIAILGSLAMLVCSALTLAIEVAHPGHLESNLTFIQFFTGQSGAASEFTLQWGVVADPLSAVALTTLAAISLLTILWALGSLRRDPGYIRFMMVMLGMTLAAAGVILATNYFQLLVFWVLQGVAAYLLIGHWWGVPEAIAAARRAFLYLGIGDALLLVAVVYVFFRYQDLSFSHLSLIYRGGQVSTNGLLILSLLLLGSAASRAAQLPLHAWIAGSTEAPAPAAAFSQGAALAPLGVYLLFRTYDLFHASPRALVVVSVIGGATAILGALWALGQDHVKRLVAYLTMSNLGLILLALGASAYSAAIFHLFTSAFAIATLALGAGAISAALRTDSLREMGGLLRRMPNVGWVMLLAVASLTGTPPLSGAFSKGAIWTPLLSPLHSLPALTMLVGSLLAGAAGFRLFAAAFLGETARRRRFEPQRIQDVGGRAQAALMVLAIPIVLAGVWALPIRTIGFLSLVRFPGLNAAHLDATAVAVAGVIGLAGAALGFVLRGVQAPGVAGALIERAFFVGDGVALVAGAAVTGTASALTFVEGRVIDPVLHAFDETASAVARLTRWVRTARAQQTALGLLIGVVLVVVLTVILSMSGFKVNG